MRRWLSIPRQTLAALTAGHSWSAGRTWLLVVAAGVLITSLQWFLDGKTVAGTPIRGPEETPDRLAALRFYTLGSAWFSFDEDVRGSLEAGKLADLAVLSADYLTVPLDEIGNIESVLTLLGGEVVYAAGDFAALEN